MRQTKQKLQTSEYVSASDEANGPDRKRRESHTESVGADGEEGHNSHENHLKPAFLPEPSYYAALTHMIREYWDIQQQRIVSNNRLKQMQRDEMPESRLTQQAYVLDELGKIEKYLKVQATQQLKTHFMADWFTDIRGVNMVSLGMIFAVAKPLENYAVPAKLWKWMGLHVTEAGTAARRTKGQKLDYSPKGRTVCRIIAENLMKQNKGKYRTFYDAKKLEYLKRERVGDSGCPFNQVHRSKGGKIIACVKEKPDGESSGHVHSAALRYMVKQFLKDLLLEWHKRIAAKRLMNSAK